MLAKLAFGNLRKSIRDYAVYFVTLVLGVAVFYAFNTISDQADFLKPEYGDLIGMLGDILMGLTVFLALVLGFLMVYANNYLVRRRKQELGLYQVLGMRRSQVSGILTLETLMASLVSLGVGLLVGVLLSQVLVFVTAALFHEQVTAFQFRFSFEALGLTLLCFGIMFVVMLLLNLASSMRRQLDMLSRGDRSNFTGHLQCPHAEVNGKTLGVIGAGHIGKEVILVARTLDMEVLAYSRTPKDDGVCYVGLDELLSRSDFVSLHCPLSDQTRHLINADTLAKMKPTACLINTSRGALVDEPALIAALQNGVIAGAGLDVQETEPPAADNPLYDMDNVILTPHMGWKGLETRQRLVALLAGNIRSYLEGRPIHVVS